MERYDANNDLSLSKGLKKSVKKALAMGSIMALGVTSESTKGDEQQSIEKTNTQQKIEHIQHELGIKPKVVQVEFTKTPTVEKTNNLVSPKISPDSPEERAMLLKEIEELKKEEDQLSGQLDNMGGR